MQIKPAIALWFSESLLRLYSATNVREIDWHLGRAERELKAKECLSSASSPELAALRWLRVALQEAAENCRSRLRPSEKAPPNVSSLARALTRRELEVVHRISLGDTDAEIGRALGISPKTASKHVENILRKLEVETRTAAAAVFLAGQVLLDASRLL